MFTSHTINSCKKMLHDYGEFNNFVDHVLAFMEDQINDEPDKVEQKDKEGYENMKTTRSELESVYKDLKIAIAARDDEKTMKDLSITLDLLEKLQEEFEKITEGGGPGEFFFYLGTNYLYSTIKRIVSKTYRKAREEIVRS
ncbi:MAG: hypothetical protein WAJ93_25475 [Candidatus Nitrosopolaris sp.]|jgi:hypothetical protein